MNKLACGIAAVGLMATVAMAEGYYLFKFEGQNATNQTNAWGGNIMGFAYNGVTKDNPAAPEGGNGIKVFSEGVAKITNAGWNAAIGQYPGIFIGLKYDSGIATTGKDPSVCIEGFSYWYKGNAAHTFILEFPVSNCTESAGYGNQWKKEGVPAASSWTQIKYQLSDFGTSDATGCGNIAKDLSKISQISWGYAGGAYDATDSKSNLNLMITNVQCLASGETGDAVGTGLPDDYTFIDSDPSSSSGGDGSSSGGYDPIVSYNSASITGLNVVSFARSLKIASGKDAMVSLFDMHGKLVLSQKVFSGTTTINLEKQRQGVYYAVVKSDSHKQTVKVILK